MVFEFVGSSWVEFISVVAGLSVPIFWIRGKEVKKVLVYPLVCIGIFLMNQLGLLFVNFIDVFFQKYIIIGTLKTTIEETSLSSLLLKCNVIFVILIVYLVKLNGKKVQQPWITQIRPYILVLVGFISFSMIIVFTRILGISLLTEERHKMEITVSYTIRGKALGILLISIGLIFIILCVWQILTLKKEEEYHWKNELYENYMKMQEDSIRRIVEKDQSMRQFRHDLYAHISALEGISGQIDNIQLQEYIAEMRKESSVYDMTIFSGIAAIDAVVSEIVTKAEQLHISLQWKGTLNGSKDVKIYDLCTIFSNLLTNAMEACAKLEKELRVIYVKTYCLEESIYINIGNHCKEKVHIGEDGRIETSKSNKKNHGFGTKNVLDTVKKNGGSIQYIAEENWFEVKIVK